VRLPPSTVFANTLDEQHTRLYRHDRAILGKLKCRLLSPT